MARIVLTKTDEQLVFSDHIHEVKVSDASLEIKAETHKIYISLTEEERKLLARMLKAEVRGRSESFTDFVRV